MPPAANPVFANVAVLRIAEFSARTVSEQASLKESLERATRDSLSGVAANDRLVLDAEDGLAVVLFGDPAHALRFAETVGSKSAAPVQAGLNHGPLALTSRGGDARVFGDGLTAAHAAARFATPGKLLVTRDFAQMLGRRNPGRAADLTNAGEFTDTRVRQHTFYTPDARKGAAHRRRMILYGVGGVAAILLLGVGAREARVRLIPPPPAVLTFNVRPRGDIVIDGMLRGRTPQTTEVEVPPGRHVVRIENAGLPAYEITLDLQPSERRTVTHTFVIPRRTPDKPDFWRDLKKKFQ